MQSPIITELTNKWVSTFNRNNYIRVFVLFLFSVFNSFDRSTRTGQRLLGVYELESQSSETTIHKVFCSSYDNSPQEVYSQKGSERVGEISRCEYTDYSTRKIILLNELPVEKSPGEIPTICPFKKQKLKHFLLLFGLGSKFSFLSVKRCQRTLLWSSTNRFCTDNINFCFFFLCFL